MKRKETILEQKLLENGYTLTGKRYKGKHSQLTKHYEYCKDIVVEYDNEKLSTTFFILLDAKRNECVDYFFLCDMFKVIGSWDKKAIDTIYNQLVEEVSQVVCYDISYEA